MFPCRLALALLVAVPAVALGAVTPSVAAEVPDSPVGGDSAGGYLLGASDGSVYDYGAGDHGSMAGEALSKPVVGLAGTPSGAGYWMVASDGGIFSFGDAGFHGSTGNIALNQPIVGMAATGTGAGYWFVASDGGIFSFGDADFEGSTGDITLNKPIVGMAATPTGEGYWMVASDGGIFSFGDAQFHGSTGDITLNKPIVGMAATPSGEGYWMVASDGGIFSFGDAEFHGSTGDIVLNKPIADMAATKTGNGYWLVSSDGGIFNFGDADFKGSAGGQRINGRIVDMLPQGGDVTAPVLHSLSFTPTSMDTSGGAQKLTVTVRVSDDVAGVAQNRTQVDFNSPSQGQYVTAFGNWTRLSGDHLDGVYQTEITIPAYSEQGTWFIPQVHLTDAAGNSTHITRGTLAAAGYPTTFTQTGPGDVTAPVLHSLSFTPTSMDTSGGAQKLTVTVRVSDDVAGVAQNRTQVDFNSPSQGQYVTAFGNWTRLSGDHLDGVYQTEITIPAYSEQGTWFIPQVHLTDAAGNSTHITRETLAAAGYPTTFTQTGPGDVTAPVLHSLSFTPTSMDTSGGAQKLTVTVRVSDDVAGVAQNRTQVDFNSPSQGQYVTAFGNWTRLSGDHLDGVYQTEITIPAYSEQGTWFIPQVHLTDAAGNSTHITRETLAAAGYPTTFEVVRTG